MSLNNLKTLANPFQFIQHDVRTAIDEQDNIWFCAKDVCDALEIVWKGSAATLENMPENWFMVLKLQTIKGEKDAIFINEAGLYRLIFRSNKPKAIDFSNWVMEEVLPTLRKQGFFGELDIKAEIALSKQIDVLSEQLVATKNAYRYQLLHDQLKRLCNLANQPLPPLEHLSKSLEQMDWTSGGDA